MNDRSDSIGLYLHIPFCLSKCHYCDFNTYESIEGLIPSFIDALEREIIIWGKRLDAPRISTIFFGGGTPSYIPGKCISRLMRAINSDMSVDAVAEITLEANPDDVTQEKLEQWLDSGVNRISIGVQSFDPSTLTSLGRRHDAETAIHAVRSARSHGFKNISIDLMFGLPNQKMTNWIRSLETAIELDTDHMSLYGLQIEPGTPLHRNVELGATPLPDDDLAADMYEKSMDILEASGYCHYEISNWCRPRMESQHNMSYWLNREYLGLGPGAHSSLQGHRFANMRSPRRYTDTILNFQESESLNDNPTIRQGDVAIDFVETTTVEISMSETMMLGMRLSRGVSFKNFEERYGVPMQDIYRDEINDLISLGLIEYIPCGIKLTRQGKLLGNEVFQRFILTNKEV